MSELPASEQVIARVHRWWYLLTVGMWRGECSITLYDASGVKVIGSGKPAGEGWWSPYRIWWERK